MIYEMALKEFGRHKLRTLLTMLGVTIGIFLVTTVSSFSEGIINYVNDQISITSGLVTVIEKDVPGFMVQSSKMEQSLADEVHRHVGGAPHEDDMLFLVIADPAA